MSEPDPTMIEFTGSVARVQTMADGGLRFIFDVPESATMQAAQLMECKRFGVVLRLTAKPEYPKEEVKVSEDGQQQPDPTISRRAAKKRK